MPSREINVRDIQALIEETFTKCPICGEEMEAMTWPWAMCCAAHGNMLIKHAKIIDNRLVVDFKVVVPLLP